jgi:succinyl-CoA synthetase beta subunit
MILYEFEGKKILQDAKVAVPNSELINSSAEKLNLKFPIVLKAQVLSGKRADAGGILFAETDEEAEKSLKTLLGKTINKENVEKVLVEEKLEIAEEYYFSLSYDTETRGPILTISASGGTGIEERASKTYPINPLNSKESLEGLDLLGIEKEVIAKLLVPFFEGDLLLLEINPLVKTPRSSSGGKEGSWMALDAKIKTDDTARGRHPEWEFPPRSAPGHNPTEREIEAKKIDEGDYRGTAGSTYFDLDGDIAILASGGGASITAMDALIASGGKAANYTEYSGNPPKEKVEKLTKIVLSKPGLHGLWIVGALANFTDIYETLSGFIDGLRYSEKELGRKIDYPIVIRRAGPNDKKAFEMLKQEAKDFDLHLYGEETSITKSAEVITKLAKEYSKKH